MHAYLHANSQLYNRFVNETYISKRLLLSKKICMNRIVTLLLLLACNITVAQDKTVKELQTESNKVIKKDNNDTIPKIWKRGGMYNINLAQGSLRNWAAGGDNFSLTITSVLN